MWPYLSEYPLSRANLWNAPMGSEPVLKINTRGVLYDMSWYRVGRSTGGVSIKAFPRFSMTKSVRAKTTWKLKEKTLKGYWMRIHFNIVSEALPRAIRQDKEVRHPNQKGRIKIVLICRWYDLIESTLEQHVWPKIWVHFHFYASEYPICPTQFIEETMLSHSVCCSGYTNLHSCLHHS